MVRSNPYPTGLDCPRPTYSIPRHIAFVPDGNRRWGRERELPIDQWWSPGAAKVREVAEWCEHAGVEIVTFWLVSVDNLTRSVEQTRVMIHQLAHVIADIAAAQRWPVRWCSTGEFVPPELSELLAMVVRETSHLPGMRVHLNIAYDGRQEIVDAFRGILRTSSDTSELAEGLTVETIDAQLRTDGGPHPDLVIRTGGEQRLSNFMIWQCAHSELYFCPSLWPSFTEKDFLAALTDYAGRHRRFGR